MKRKIFIFLFGIVISLAGMSQAYAAHEIDKDKDYLVLPDNPSATALAQSNPHKVVVIEFFNYNCPACYKLEPHLENWLHHKHHHVIFQRIPVTFQPDWVFYAKAYLALQALNTHDRINKNIFAALHFQNLKLSDEESFGNFLQSQNIVKKDFVNAYHSPDIETALSKNQKITSDFMVFQVPALVIDGKYKVDPSLSGGDYKRMFETVNTLIHNVQRQRNNTDSDHA